MQATASAAARGRLRQGFGLVVYRPRAAPQAVAGSKTQGSADHGKAAARLPRRAGGAGRLLSRAADPDRPAVADLLPRHQRRVNHILDALAADRANGEVTVLQADVRGRDQLHRTALG